MTEAGMSGCMLVDIASGIGSPRLSGGGLGLLNLVIDASRADRAPTAVRQEAQEPEPRGSQPVRPHADQQAKRPSGSVADVAPVEPGMTRHDDRIVASHDGHEIIAASGRRRNGEMVGWLTCADCQVILQPVPICGQPTLKGRPCRSPIRTDLGYDRCWSHGEGRGRTSTPRRSRKAS